MKAGARKLTGIAQQSGESLPAAIALAGPAHETPHETHYRADIDGLRAVAVLAVVFYHAFPKSLPGGFVGVDVFFVISGYLISGILLRDIADTCFSLRRFYARRIRRIVPALLPVLAAVLGYGFVVLLPAELARLGADTAGSAGFVANLMLWQQAGYFDRATEAKPLMHLWSLGVEEQFYVLWPLALWGLGNRARTGAALLAIAVLSFLLNLALAAQNPTADFYSPFTRLWELACGALLAWRAHRHSADLPAVASLGGLAAIAAAVFLFGAAASAYPGWWALLPVLGTAALIGTTPSAPAKTWLAHPAAVALGRISYPLYLWHWPLFSYAFILRRGRPPTALMALALVAASVLLAAATYAWVERPLRFGPRRKAKVLALSAALGGIGIAGLAVWMAHGFPDRFPPLPNLDVAAIDTAMAEPVFRPTRSMSVTQHGRILVTRIGTGVEAVLFAGDSLVMQYGPRVQQIYDEGRLRRTVYFVTGASCPPIPGVVRSGMFAECAALPRIASDLVSERRIGTVLLGAFWQGYPGPNRIQAIAAPAHDATAQLYRNLTQYVQAYIREKRAVFLILCAPVSQIFDPARMIRRFPTGFAVDRSAASGAPMHEITAGCDDTDRHLRAVAASTGASTLDPLPAICGTGPVCASLFRNEPRFADDKHLRPGYVRSQITLFDTILTK